MLSYKITERKKKEMDEKKRIPIPTKRLIIGGIALFLAITGWLLAANCEGFSDLYGFNVYPLLVNIFARISNIFPFSLAEIIVILAVLLVIFSIVFFIVKLIRSKGRRLSFILSSLSTVFCVLSSASFIFVYSCGVNYHRKPFSDFSGLTVRPYSREEVREALLYTIEETNSLIQEIELDEEYACILPENIMELSREAMNRLGEEYPVMDSYYPNVKPVMLSELMCYGRITGIFTPFTMEANYNTKDMTGERGFTLCHELSHLTGFMQEEEANFIAYLACRESDDPYMRYSGYSNALSYLLNAYASTRAEDYGEVYSLINPITIYQFAKYNEFWDSYKTDFGEIATAINDTYLKINGQEDGTKSYGRVTDLIIADYLKNK